MAETVIPIFSMFLNQRLRRHDEMPSGERGFPFAWLVVVASFILLFGLILAVSVSGPLHLLHHRQPPTALGMTLSKPDGQGGVLVTSLQQKGPAEQAGIEVGDRILTVGERPAISASAVHEAVSSSSSAIIDLRVMHEGREHVIRLNRRGSQDES